MTRLRYVILIFTLNSRIMSEQEIKQFEENIVKGADIAFRRLVNEKKKEGGELVFARDGCVFHVKASDLSVEKFW